jgi:hypothetical protein
LTVPERNSDLTATFATLSTHTTKLRIAMQEALEKVLPLSSGARACGRALGLKRSLGWQVYALANASDAATTLRALPRVQGWDFILQAFARSGCPARELNALRAEAKALESFLRLSRIDRDLLRAAACGGLDSARETNAMLRARRAATTANERIFGIAAHTILTAVILAPADRRGRFDSISATFLHGIKRSRAGSPWPIYLSAEMTAKRGERLQVGSRSRGSEGALPFLEELSTPKLLKDGLQRREHGEAVLYELLDRGAARSEPVHTCFLEHQRAAGTCEHTGERSELHLSTNLPTRFAIFEVWIHRSHQLSTKPSASLVGSPRVFGTFPEPPESLRLPLDADAEEITSSKLPTATRSCCALRRALLQRAFEVSGHDVEEFEGFRVIVRDPPIHARIVLAWHM